MNLNSTEGVQLVEVTLYPNLPNFFPLVNGKDLAFQSRLFSI
jgi:hypothetical protein